MCNKDVLQLCHFWKSSLKNLPLYILCELLLVAVQHYWFYVPICKTLSVRSVMYWRKTHRLLYLMVKEHILLQGNATKLTRNEYVALSRARGGTVGVRRNGEGQGGRTACAGRNDMASPLRDDFFILKRRRLFTEGSNSRGWAAAGLEDKTRIFTLCWPLNAKIQNKWLRRHTPPLWPQKEEKNLTQGSAEIQGGSHGN